MPSTHTVCLSLTTFSVNAPQQSLRMALYPCWAHCRQRRDTHFEYKKDPCKAISLHQTTPATYSNTSLTNSLSSGNFFPYLPVADLLIGRHRCTSLPSLSLLSLWLSLLRHPFPAPLSSLNVVLRQSPSTHSVHLRLEGSPLPSRPASLSFQEGG